MLLFCNIYIGSGFMKNRKSKKFICISFIISFVGTINLFLNRKENKNIKKFEINENNSDIRLKKEEA